MPYDWTRPHSSKLPDATRELHLWPHRSLTPRGYVFFIATTCVLICLPLFIVIGTVLLWAILPFILVAVGGMWLALDRNRHNLQIIEVLTLTPDRARLVRRNPDGRVQSWDCNRYWTTPELHPEGGPVPQYLTLRGCGRTVEIGAFLSEEERLALYDELVRVLRNEDCPGRA